MSERRQLDDVETQDDRAATAEAAETERDENLVNEEAAGDEVTIPSAAEIDQPALLPADGI